MDEVEHQKRKAHEELGEENSEADSFGFDAVESEEYEGRIDEENEGNPQVNTQGPPAKERREER